jgi:hypothetical protein
MSAKTVAQKCYDKWEPTEKLPDAMRDDIDLLAGHFYHNGTFPTVFIGSLVPWNDLVGEPNDGHAAVADLLISRAANATLSANFDPLIEQWAERRKIALQGALNGVEAMTFTNTSNPLLKFHGCFHRDKKNTLWTQHQLQQPEVKQRIENCANWMELNLPNKDLLVVGFWTDWGYLNDVLAQTIQMNGISSVTLIDLATSAALQAKAPLLWSTLNAAGIPFDHVQASGADALKELRIEFSRVWAKKFFHLGKPLLEAAGGTYPTAVESAAWTCDDIYNLRRDAEGVPYSRAAQTKEPGPEAAQAAFAHLLLTQANATRQGSWYTHGGQTIRVVQGAGQGLSSVRDKYVEPPNVPAPDIVLCAGANDIPVPGKIIASGSGHSIVRPAPGGTTRWLTLEQARLELGL